ncbi:MAG: biopolymer transporter ExbD [Magnetococcales bacterium]|nr:biopolymer transporter ExbD [Magnetococcales bacterium]
MRFRKRTRQSVTLDITPLIDVVFLLVLFFMVTTTFTTVGGLRLDLPEAETNENEETPEEIRVTIDREGRFHLEETRLNEEALRNALIAAVKKRKDRVLIIQADKNASHGRVVRVMDLAKTVGLNRLAIATKNEKVFGDLDSAADTRK